MVSGPFADGLRSLCVPEFLCSSLLNGWDQGWDLLAGVLSVYSKVVVQRKDDYCRMLFGQPYDTGVRKGHGKTLVLVQQSKDGVHLLGSAKRNVQNAAPYELEHGGLSTVKASDQKAGFGKNGFAGKERRRDLCPLIPGPPMMPVGLVEQGYQGTGVEDDLAFYWPKFSR